MQPIMLGLVEFEKGAIFVNVFRHGHSPLGLVEFEKGAIFVVMLI